MLIKGKMETLMDNTEAQTDGEGLASEEAQTTMEVEAEIESPPCGATELEVPPALDDDDDVISPAISRATSAKSQKSNLRPDENEEIDGFPARGFVFEPGENAEAEVETKKEEGDEVEATEESKSPSEEKDEDNVENDEETKNCDDDESKEELEGEEDKDKTNENADEN